jgi:hypothetical protein
VSAFFGCIAVAGLFWVLTVFNLTIVSFPPDALYLFSSLPPFYWVGLSLAVVSMTIVITVGRNTLAENEKFLSLVVLVLFLYGIAPFSYENARYTDPYLHMARTMFVVGHASYSVMSVEYLAEFPGVFAYFAAVLRITGIPTFVLMKFFPLFIVFGIALGTYLMAKSVGLSNPIVPALFLVAVNPFPEFHFSPQATVFFFYVLFWGILLRGRFLRPSRKVFVFSVMFFLAILVSNPTTTLMTVVAVVFSAIVLYAKGPSGSDRKQWKLNLLFVLLFVLLFLVWVASAAPTTLDYIVGRGRVALEGFEEFDSLIGAIFRRPLSCGLSYCTVLLLERDFLIVYAAFVLICILALLLSRNGSHRPSPLLTTWFVSTLAFLSVATQFENTYISRSFLYGLFPVSIAAGMVLERRKTRADRKWVNHFLAVVKVLALVFLISAPGVLTVSRYGEDSFHYIPSSGLYAADFAAAQSTGRVLIFSPQAWEFRFYRTIYGGTPDLLVNASGSIYYTGVGFFDGRLAFRKISSEPHITTFDSIIFVDYVLNFYLLREGAPGLAEVQKETERMVATRCNMIFADSSVRIYQPVQ